MKIGFEIVGNVLGVLAGVAWTGSSWVEVHSDLRRAEEPPLVGKLLGGGAVRSDSRTEEVVVYHDTEKEASVQ